MDLGVLLAPAVLLVSAGAAWGGAKAALNGTRKRVEEIRDGLAEHTKMDTNVQREILDRLIRIETKVEGA